MHTVFISYSTKDTQQAETVRNVLEYNAIPCWMAPRDIPGGSNYTKEIPIAIRDCQVFVLILSTNSQNSHWVLKELDSAVNAGKVILPFMLEECQLSDEFNFLLTGAQRYSAYQKKAEALEALIGRIRAITDGVQAPVSEAPTPEVAPVPQPRAMSHGTPKKPDAFLGTARCPACGGSDLEHLEKKTGRFTPAERSTLLLTPLIAAAGGAVALIVSVLVLMFIPSAADAIGYLSIAACLVGIVVGWILGRRQLYKRIRRSRVRRQLHPNPFRCRACQKEFLLDRSQVTL